MSIEAIDSYVGVAVDGTGKKIQNLQHTVMQSDGTPIVVQTQVTATADDQGRVVDTNLKPWLEAILLEMQETRKLTSILVGAFGGGTDQAAVPAYIPQRGLPPAVSQGSYVNAISDPFGRQVVVPWGARDIYTVSTPQTITDNTSHTLISSVADTYLDMVSLIITNTSAATNSRVDISDGTNTYAFQSIGGGPSVGFTSGLVLPATNKSTAWTIQAASAVTDIRVFAIFVKNR